MSDLSSVERLKIEALFGMESGYVLDFSNNTFSMFTVENVGIDIFDRKYEYGSNSKANRLRKFWLEESNEVVGKLLSALLDYWLAKKQINGEELSSKEKILYDECQKIVRGLNQASPKQIQDYPFSLFQKGSAFINEPNMTTTKRPLKVFLCHSSQDKPIVRELHDRLLSEGWIDPWLDKEKLHLGEDFDLEIEKAIESTDAVIAFISENAVKKTGYIQKELRLVYDAQMYRPDGELFTIPLRLEECEPPHRFKYWHWGNYFGEEKEKTYRSLLNSLKLIHERVLNGGAAEKSRLEAEELERQKAAKEKVEREFNEHAERERKEKELLEKQKLEIVEKDEQEKRLKILQRQAKSFEENNKLDEALKVYLEIEKIDPFIAGVDQKIVELQKKIHSNEMLLRLIKANNSQKSKLTQNNEFFRNKLPILTGVMGVIFCIVAIVLASLLPSFMQKIITTPTVVLPSHTATSSQSVTSTFTPLITKTVTPNLTLLNTSTSTAILIATDNRIPDTYVLKEGEYSYCIARRFNVDPDELLKKSGLTSPDIYYTGLTLIIPQGTTFPGTRTLMKHPATYTVASSDETIYSIACKFGDVFPEDIAILNGLLIDNPLSIGQLIDIP